MIILFTLACIFTLLYILFVLVLILLLLYYLDHSWACHPCCIHLDYHILVWLVCRHRWYTCALLDCLLHDYFSLMLLYVVCPCGPHIYPFTSNPLVSVISFILVLKFASVRPCVYLFLWASQWLGVKSSNRLYRCLGTFWKMLTYWCWLEFDIWRLV